MKNIAETCAKKIAFLLLFYTTVRRVESFQCGRSFGRVTNRRPNTAPFFPFNDEIATSPALARRKPSILRSSRRQDPNLTGRSFQDRFGRLQRWGNMFSNLLFEIGKVVRSLVERTTIYVLECQDGKYYVGMTTHRRRRLRQHFQSDRFASAWTQTYPPQKVVREYRRVPSRFALGMEAQVTAELMWEYGVNNVRGAMFSHPKPFTGDDIDSLVSFIGHFNSLSYQKVRDYLEPTLPTPKKSIRCFRCGKYGHVASTCSAKIAKKKTPLTRKKCRLCGKFGHIAVDCSQIGFDITERTGKLDLDGW